MRPFDWCRNQRPWMTLNGRYALYSRKDASFGAHHKNLNEDRHILSAEKCRPVTVVSGSVRYMRTYSWRFPGYGASNDRGACRQRHFSIFRWLFFSDTLEMRPALLWRYAVRRRIFSDTKMRHLE